MELVTNPFYFTVNQKGRYHFKRNAKPFNEIFQIYMYKPHTKPLLL